MASLGGKIPHGLGHERSTLEVILLQHVVLHLTLVQFSVDWLPIQQNSLGHRVHKSILLVAVSHDTTFLSVSLVAVTHYGRLKLPLYSQTPCCGTWTAVQDTNPAADSLHG